MEMLEYKANTSVPETSEFTIGQLSKVVPATLAVPDSLDLDHR